ncbi:MAG: sulfatase [Planctomycetaceae bacterium]|nr:sulfatase [Planctomycetaceae bacterium]
MGPLILAVLLSLDLSTTSGSPGSPRDLPSRNRPNIVVIFVDDMGYADIEPFGCTTYPTPNLTRMAKQGRRFTDCLVSSAVCSSSRAGLLTGCYHQRIGIDGALGPASEIGINEQETTLAELCRSQGYATACFGKWHLGHHPKFLPTNHGFDRYFGIPYSNDMWPLHPDVLARRQQQPDFKSPWPPLPLLRSQSPGEIEIVNANMQPEDQKLLTRQLTTEAVQFIRENSERPFLVYLPHPMVHVPLYVSPEFDGRSGTGIFGDAVMEVDWSVGEILRTLDELKLTDNTLVIFTSDNGPWLSYGEHAGSAGPLREGKGTMFEGGCRVPMLMQWTGTIPAGTTCNELISTLDIVPTVAQLIGAALPEHPVDGRDIGPLLRGEANATSPHDYLYLYYSPLSLHAIRTPRWKLHLPHPYRSLSGRAGGREGLPVPYDQKNLELSLFDLSVDVGESMDVKDQHPDVVAELLEVAQRARRELGDQLTEMKGTGQRAPGRMGPGDKRLIWE